MKEISRVTVGGSWQRLWLTAEGDFVSEFTSEARDGGAEFRVYK